MVEYGNQYWKRRKKHGRPRRFNDPEQLEIAFDKYRFDTIERPEFTVMKGGKNAGEQMLIFSHPQLMTLNEFFRWIGISPATWQHWKRNRPDLKDVITSIERQIFEYKFDGVRAGHFPPACIQNYGDLKRALKYRPYDFVTMNSREYAHWWAANNPNRY